MRSDRIFWCGHDALLIATVSMSVPLSWRNVHKNFHLAILFVKIRRQTLKFFWRYTEVLHIYLFQNGCFCSFLIEKKKKQQFWKRYMFFGKGAREVLGHYIVSSRFSFIFWRLFFSVLRVLFSTSIAANFS